MSKKVDTKVSIATKKSHHTQIFDDEGNFYQKAFY